MCRLAAADIAECPVTVSDIEVLRTGKSYTADTMTELKAQYPDDALFLLMGEDMFCTVEKWYHPERISPRQRSAPHRVTRIASKRLSHTEKK